MSVYDERPWTKWYAPWQGHARPPGLPTPVAAFAAATRDHPDLPLLHYFDGTLTVRDVDQASDSFACALFDGGVRAGDRVGLYLQNVPQFVIALLAVWKVGGIVVPLNPMLRARELSRLLLDARPNALVCLESLYLAEVREVLAGQPIPLVVTTSGLDYQSRADPRLFGSDEKRRGDATADFDGTVDFVDAVQRHRGQQPAPVLVDPDHVAALIYTSGTTGIPKGAMTTHRNLVSNGQSTRDWMGLTADDTILGVAPLFHITGLVCQVITALMTPAALVLSYRFEPDVMLDSVRERRASFAIGAVTAFVALLGARSFTPDALTALKRAYSGGAPVSPAIAREFEAATGHQLHNCYGLTEASAPTHFAPFGVPTPVDPRSGALSIGVPTPGTEARIVGDDGADLPPGEVGELVVAGPQVVPGYWGRPAETTDSLSDGWLRTGDVAFMDADGWFYLVDRKKDMIIASGYKVWPREVEDALYEHPAVREVAVVGVPDSYRGETVKAFVSLRPGSSATVEELIEFGRDRLSAYKYPRQVEILDELPKTTSGKILRRELRRQSQ